MHGCEADSWEDFTADGADRTIRTELFRDSASRLQGVYIPRCMKIRRGQTIHWDVTYSSHPTVAGIEYGWDASNPGSPNNPIDHTAGVPLDVTFDSAGTFPYWCGKHERMVGAVHVVE